MTSIEETSAPPPREARRKFMVVVDSTPECLTALRYAARRAEHTRGGVAMLYVIEPEDGQIWRSVGERMRQEARAQAEKRLGTLAAEVQALAGITPEFAIREGRPAEEILAYLGEDHDISILVLAAGVGGEGPGPLVSTLAGQMSGRMPVPITVVPGSLSLAQIDALS
ncbi:universal stress protein [Neomegalonema perideroedes]|uniref:universal stress protein n=1 Tax=Neomegalonema perideroedes TaxID=217219 RepID=UPI0003673E9A|nr:universal stress protein [Neomegalonema perideroedes]